MDSGYREGHPSECPYTAHPKPGIISPAEGEAKLRPGHHCQEGNVPRSSTRFRGAGGAARGAGTWLAGGAAGITGGTSGATGGAGGAMACGRRKPCGKSALASTRGIPRNGPLSCGRLGPNKKRACPTPRPDRGWPVTMPGNPGNLCVVIIFTPLFRIMDG